MEPDEGPGRRHRSSGLQLHPPEVRRRGPLVLRGGRLQSDAVRSDGGGVGGGPQGGLLRLTPSAGARTSASARSNYPATVEVRRLGRTGHRSSVAILGGAAFWDADRDVAANAFTAALATGVNHLDVAPQYGRAQELLGPLIPPVRDGLFVACTTLRHSRDGVRAQLEESLRLLH